jgi:nucleoside-diphosphate-sugar epimerase
MMRVLLTGATGILGAEVRDQLTQAGGVELTCVARRPGPLAQAVVWNMGREVPPRALGGSWDVIIHCAADTRWSQTQAQALEANVQSVRALASVASPYTHVIHISTAAVVGPRGDGRSEDPGDYRNMYEWSKACAERLARDRFQRLTIIRPPLVIGRRADGRAARFAGMYMLLRGITASSLPSVVADPEGFFDVVPVDDLARTIISMMDRLGGGEPVTPAGGAAAPRISEAVELIYGALNEWRARQGVAPVDVPPFVDPESWQRFYRPFAEDLLSHRQRLTLERLDYFLPYLKLTEPFAATHPVLDAQAAIAPSVRYWAECNPRLASLAPRPWQAPRGAVAAYA